MLLYDLNENLDRKMDKVHDYNKDIDRFLRSFDLEKFQILFQNKNTSKINLFISNSKNNSDF